MEKDWLEQIKDERAAIDSQYAQDRPKIDIVSELISLRRELGLTQAEVAARMGVAGPRVSEIESKPWKVSLDRIYRYARAMGANLVVRKPGPERDNEQLRADLEKILATTISQLAGLRHSS